MAEKVLNLKLKYKGKYLDTVRYKKDFRKRFIIGSDKHLFWQILDAGFPKRYQFINKMGSNFVIHLRDNMQAIIKKEGKELSTEDLKREKLLRGNKLFIDEKTEGVVKLGNDWEIEFAYAVPYRYVPTEEELRIARQFAKWPSLTKEQKFTRIFLTLGLLFTAVGLYIASVTYEPPKVVNLTERLRKIEEIATKIQPEVVEEKKVTEVQRKVKSEEEIKAEEEKKKAEEEKKQAEVTAEEFKKQFGFDIGEAETSEEDLTKELLEVTQVDEIVAASVTGEGAGTGEGKGPGPKGTGGGTVLDDIASKTELNLTAGLGEISGLEGLDLGGESGLEEVDLAKLGGEVENFKITKVESKAQFEKVKKRFAGIRAIKEGSIKLEEQTPQFKTEIANISQQVNAYKPQINRLFTVETMMVDMYGSLDIEIIIEADGSIAAVNVTAVSGSYFTDSFLNKVRNTIMKWKIKVKKPVIYSFRMKFLKP